MLDYVPWPAFRELAVQIPAMQERMEWLMDMSSTLRCDWSFPIGEPIQKSEETGLPDLCPSAKVCHFPLTFVRSRNVALKFARFRHNLIGCRHINNADALQKSLRDLSNWSVGPSFRGYVSNADSYVRIRVEEF